MPVSRNRKQHKAKKQRRDKQRQDELKHLTKMNRLARRQALLRAAHGDDDRTAVSLDQANKQFEEAYDSGE